jgi:hypothetical protein
MFPTFRVPNPWSYKLLASSVVILTLLNPGAPSSPSRGRWTKSTDFVLTEQDLHQSSRGHVIHAHPTHGTKSYVLRYPRTLHLSNSRLFIPGSVPSPGYAGDDDSPMLVLYELAKAYPECVVSYNLK